MHDDYDEDGIQTETRQLVLEIQTDAENLNIAANRSDIPDDLKHAIAALADKIDGLRSIIR